ncbi:hypothetical protein [Saccharopolyspora gloriosae]|uniref:hypothetical protein n=1 Tax=Saccharopolyspora gloriosae TaxID=455344 RepID=UPI001FB7BBA1|nr:hypothetical protein [Saccharopolyspora gloriosae]
MTSENVSKGFQLQPEELTTQVAALTAIGEGTTGLVNSAGELAQRLPMLGTAPPALHLAMKLRQAAGETGLSGEVGGADTRVNTFHASLQETVTGYLNNDAEIQRILRAAGGEQP